MILHHVRDQHASKNTLMHALYAHFYLGMKRQDIARVFHKSLSTLSNWIQRFESTGDNERVHGNHHSSFTQEQKEWIINFFEAAPLSFLDEAKRAFEREYKTPIAISTVWRIIHSYGLTWKVLERRAMHIKERDIFRFYDEINSLDWSHWNLQFIDEVSFDSRGMLRKRGYALKGKKLCIRGEFERRPRVSLLCFLDATGFVEVFETEGTFDREKFVKYCLLHAANVQGYPGRGSIWILDGASIHCHPDIVYLLRSLGIVPIFLPAYCAFFNPIEYAFSFVKRAFRRSYAEAKTRDLTRYVLTIMQQFKAFDMTKTFQHCGYKVQGYFDPTMRLADECTSTKVTSATNTLGFIECQ
ncbi:hypothetical protein Ae201684P_004011 [Aphanomyces euteiches]|uniref:Tc1-like transposase DDE domain-containing protein n=1 Tax=Aphanomyces euteiches TaxID=100861 RepID=A0A6G0XT74_9STRA|nr:hypothetical protein Ae201684_001703 [Aphanomyces euteiches]KAH9075330.1 hypothetical protein Ae201684P_004011 [Aphanomyces euteiches]